MEVDLVIILQIYISYFKKTFEIQVWFRNANLCEK